MKKPTNIEPAKLASYTLALLVVAGAVDMFFFDGQYGAPVWQAIGHQAEMAKAAFQRVLNQFA